MDATKVITRKARTLRARRSVGTPKGRAVRKRVASGVKKIRLVVADEVYQAVNAYANQRAVSFDDVVDQALRAKIAGEWAGTVGLKDRLLDLEATVAGMSGQIREVSDLIRDVIVLYQTLREEGAAAGGGRTLEELARSSRQSRAEYRGSEWLEGDDEVRG